MNDHAEDSGPARDIEPLISVARVASMLDLSRRTIEELVASGELPSLKIGKRRLVHPDDLREFIDARRGARS